MHEVSVNSQILPKVKARKFNENPKQQQSNVTRLSAPYVVAIRKLLLHSTILHLYIRKCLQNIFRSYYYIVYCILCSSEARSTLYNAVIFCIFYFALFTFEMITRCFWIETHCIKYMWCQQMQLNFPNDCYYIETIKLVITKDYIGTQIDLIPLSINLICTLYSTLLLSLSLLLDVGFSSSQTYNMILFSSSGSI